MAGSHADEVLPDEIGARSALGTAYLRRYRRHAVKKSSKLVNIKFLDV